MSENNIMKIDLDQAHAQAKTVGDLGEKIQDSGRSIKNHNIFNAAHAGSHPDWQRAADRLHQRVEQFSQGIISHGDHTVAVSHKLKNTFHAIEELDADHDSVSISDHDRMAPITGVNPASVTSAAPITTPHSFSGLPTPTMASESEFSAPPSDTSLSSFVPSSNLSLAHVSADFWWPAGS